MTIGYELKVIVLLKRDVHYQQAQEEVGRLLSFSMLRDKELKAFHKEKGYKFYVFNNLFPTEENGIYQKGKLYFFRLRAVHHRLIEKIKECLSNLANDVFQVIASEIHSFHPRFINMLYTVTPTIVTIDNGPFFPDDDLLLLKQRLEENAQKKYMELFAEDPNRADFIERIELINRTPTITRYKNMSFLGNKLRVFVRPDEISQKLADVVVFSGLGEKSSSIGAGFCFVY
ncbi:CRISPR-associated endoribonuclease Cas6 [Sporolactobacillus putidus]|uniref:CRISPR-associated endoribonuclease Cas6 n=1 Tax=Sporolactobacillus putidus TaxID=492735 RepID=A0A917W3G0_9BACL|nr:CRISPR-associated endoribonuclease Cas6 [Sporolactobacillus putidus]GGL59343.1 CRISPR-associated endoribonuclease Cas6 [Sporolactobacillus putidus]